MSKLSEGGRIAERVCPYSNQQFVVRLQGLELRAVQRMEQDRRGLPSWEAGKRVEWKRIARPRMSQAFGQVSDCSHGLRGTEEAYFGSSDSRR